MLIINLTIKIYYKTLLLLYLYNNINLVNYYYKKLLK